MTLPGTFNGSTAHDSIAPPEKIHHLRAELAEYYHRPEYLRYETMGALSRQNLESIRRETGQPIVPE